MKDFTQEMLEKLQKANDAVIGTTEYYKFRMAIEFKTNNRWIFASYGIPRSIGKIKTFKGKTYIIIEWADNMERYTVTETVKELLGI